MTLVCDWLKILTISFQPIREKNSNFLSCILQWPQLVSFFVSLCFFSSSSYFKILITTPHIMLKIYQLPYFYNKLHMNNKFYYNPTSGHLVSKPITWQNILQLKLGDIQGYTSRSTPQFSNLTSNIENSVSKI